MTSTPIPIRRRRPSARRVFAAQAALTLGIVALAVACPCESRAQQAGDNVGPALYLDPRSGTVTSARPQGPAGEQVLRLKPIEANMLSTSSEGLEVKSSGARGVAVDLDGRFQQMSVVTIDEDGNLRKSCVAAGDVDAPAAGSGATDAAADPASSASGADR